MESLRHRNIREIEEMKFEFQRTFDRRTRIIQIELEILPKIWSLLLVATNRTKSAQARFRMSSDLTSMTKEDLAEWLDAAKISKINQNIILQACPEERNQLYSKADDIRLCHEARLAAMEARNFLTENAILLPSDIFSELIAFSKLIDDAAFEAEMDALHGRLSKEDRKSDNFWKDSSEAIDNLGQKVRSLIRSEFNTDTTAIMI